MRKWKKMLGSLLTAGLILGMTAATAVAADGEGAKKGYTYKITLSAGDKGVLPGEVVLEASYGDNVRFDLSQVQVTDERYYVKGIKPSGRDFIEDGSASGASYYSVIPRVVGDADYVVAYGVKGNQVAYTANYRDAQGNELAPSTTFYGNIGDKPVVAYKYIDNYVPQVLALTKTLSANEAENVFDFVYDPGATATIVETTTTVATVVPATATPAQQAGAGAEAPAEGTEAPQDQTEGEDTTVAPDEDVPLENQDVVDLDDEETPQSNIEVKETPDALPMTASIVTGITAVLALGALIVVFLKKKAK